MCSNTSSGSYGDLQDDYFGSCPKKQKKDKVRRRGPGVAELEKIRLQEQNKSSVSSLSLPNFDHTLLPPPPETSLYTINHISKPPAKATATASGGCDLVMLSPNFALPFSSYFANGSFPKDLIPPAPAFQRNQQHSSNHKSNHKTMNLHNPSQGSVGFYEFIEPPSNQRSTVDNVTQFMEGEQKIVSAKRPWHSVTNTTKASLGPSMTISRDTKQNRSLDMRLISPVQDSGTTICNPIAIDSPTLIRGGYQSFIPLSLQYEQQQQKDFDENMQLRRMKPYYSFITSDDRSNGDQYESATDHGIDLSLKL